MSHFYGQITQSGRKTIPTARGHKTTGLIIHAQSWEGDIKVHLQYCADKKKNIYTVSRCTHGHDFGDIIAQGYCDGSDSKKDNNAIFITQHCGGAK